MARINLRESWNLLSAYYQSQYALDTDAAHYGVFAPNEQELHLLGDIAGKRILEIGCGGAQCSVAFSKQGAECVAVDLSDQQIKYARALAEREGVKIALHRRSMIAFLKTQPPAGFDIVFSSYALQYVENLALVFAQVRRVLKAGGLFVFSLDYPLSDITCRVGRHVTVRESYFKRGRMQWDWKTDKGKRIANFYSFHRTVSDFLNPLVGAGFAVEALLEPEPPAETDPWGADYAHCAYVPATIIWKARVPPPGYDARFAVNSCTRSPPSRWRVNLISSPATLPLNSSLT